MFVNNKWIWAIVLIFLVTPLLAQGQNVISVESSNYLSGLRPHPCLMLTDERLGELKALYESDDTLKGCVAATIDKADGLVGGPVLERKLVGIRMLDVSRDFLPRIYALGVAWRWTGEEKYQQAAVKNLIAICRFEDWNYKHFLDTAEMTHAVAIGYDWFYDSFSDAERTEIRRAIIEKGLEPGYNIHLGKLKTSHNWPAWKNNWNQVCNYSMIIGSLAVAETDPVYAEKLLPLAVKSLPLAMVQYKPDGAWPEGPGYWEYATSYTVYGLCALDTALGTDFGLMQFPGLAETAYFPIYMTGPTGQYYNFADSRRDNLFTPPYPFSMWLGQKFNIPFVLDDQHKKIANRRGKSLTPLALDVVFYQPDPELSRDEILPLDKLFNGTVQTAVFRSSWTDPDALFVAVKTGDNQFPHAQLDLGNFILDALSVRWVCDLGADYYDLPGYWEMGENGRRWSYFRLNNRSHNVLTIDDTNQNVYAKAQILDFESNKDDGSAVMDLSEAYEMFSPKTIRKVSLRDQRRKVIVEDKLQITSDCTITWGITTRAQIKLVSDNVAELTMDEKKMVVELQRPSNVSFYVTRPKVEPPQYDLDGAIRLEAKVNARVGIEKISVLFSPVWHEN